MADAGGPVRATHDASPRREDAKERQGGRWDEDDFAAVTVDSAVAVHRALGPGLLESAYAAAMSIELSERGVPFERECPVQARYRDRPLGVVYRADLVLGGSLMVESKAVAALEPIHSAQLLSYLRLTGMKLGLLLNFNVPVMKSGIRRIVNGL